MYKRRTSTKSGLFLIELIIAILFFSLASAICIQLFIKAHFVSSNSEDLSMALNQSQSVAEYFKASNGTSAELVNMLDGELGEKPNEIILNYDKNWNTAVTNPVYQLSISLDEKNPVTATISVTKVSDKDNIIYSLETKKYIHNK